MTVWEIKQILADIPDEFDIAMDNGNESLIPICHTDSHVTQIQFNDNGKKYLYLCYALVRVSRMKMKPL